MCNQLLFLYSVVEVGLLPLNSTVSENETFPVCVELTAGSLERNITISLLVGNGSAMGKYHDDINTGMDTGEGYGGCSPTPQP